MAGFLGDTGAVGAANQPGWYNSDTLVEGGPNTINSVSLEQQSSVTSVFTSVQGLLGSLGQTAREVGRTVAQVQETVRGVPDAYRAGRAQGQQEVQALNWWQRRTEFEQATIVLAVVGLSIAVIKG